MTVYALLDSPQRHRRLPLRGRSPGEQTTVDVECRLFLRARGAEARHRAAHQHVLPRREHACRTFDDFRPEVHDSDGLLLNFGSGEWLWRPLDNPRTLQRERASACRHPRASACSSATATSITTRTSRRAPSCARASGSRRRATGATGRVELVEIPTKSRHQRQHRRLLGARASRRSRASRGASSYTHVLVRRRPDAAARRPRRRDAARRAAPSKDAHRFVDRLRRQEARPLPADTVLRGVVTVARRRRGGRAARPARGEEPRHAAAGGSPSRSGRRRSEPVELRAFLDQGGEALTETWSYVHRAVTDARRPIAGARAPR